TTFNSLYVLGVDGFVIDTVLTRWNDARGFPPQTPGLGERPAQAAATRPPRFTVDQVPEPDAATGTGRTAGHPGAPDGSGPGHKPRQTSPPGAPRCAAPS
ncbi:hypothetical protein AB0E16_09800, partial [Streptomyces sp. NPDC047970]